MFASPRIVCKGCASAAVGAYGAILLKSNLDGITQTTYDISDHQAFIRRESEIPNSTCCVIGKALFIDEVIICKIDNLLISYVKTSHEILLLYALFWEGYLLRISQLRAISPFHRHKKRKTKA